MSQVRNKLNKALSSLDNINIYNANGEKDVVQINKNKNKRRVAILLFDLIFAFGTPYLMAVFYALIHGVSFSSTFGDYQSIKYAIVGFAIFAIYVSLEIYYETTLIYKRQDLFKELLACCFIITTTMILSIIAATAISIYAVPLCMIGLLIGILINRKFAIYVNIVCIIVFYLCIVVITQEVNAIPVFIGSMTQIISSAILILVSGKKITRLKFLFNSLASGFFVAFVLTFILQILDALDTQIIIMTIIVNSVWSGVSIILSLAIVMILLPLFENIFLLYSNYKLDELSQPSAKLVNRLATEAPGTYNHSLAMANLAEACAMAIGENPALARCACMYHDMGKLEHPIYFTENQTGFNIHERIIPDMSVQIIKKHTSAGADMIRANNLPEILAKVAEEHHGTQAVSYFLSKTRGFTEDKVEMKDFCYDGPKPSTKISGLVMIVDTVEAATRSQGINNDRIEFVKFIHMLIKSKLDQGQFSECPLTIKDIQIIEDTLVNTLPSLYHQRIKYNNN